MATAYRRGIEGDAVDARSLLQQSQASPQHHHAPVAGLQQVTPGAISTRPLIITLQSITTHGFSPVIFLENTMHL